MTIIRKKAISSFFALTTIAISTLSGSFIYLNEKIPTDPAYIETNTETIASNCSFDIEGARKYYSEEDIFSFLTKANQAEFNRHWYRMVTIVLSCYSILTLGIIAVVFRKESKSVND